MHRQTTREVRIGTIAVGGSNPVAVQSMCATRTQDIDATVEQAEAIRRAGGDVVRVAVDNPKDVEALARDPRARRRANLVVDLQENYRLAAQVAPHVDKIRYNPGHLYHHEKEKPVAGEGALPGRRRARPRLRAARRRQLRQRRSARSRRAIPEDDVAADARVGARALRLLDDLGFTRYVRVAQGLGSAQGHRGQPPLRRGCGPTCRCTSASPRPACRPTASSRRASPSSSSLSRGIGDTLRVSLTVPNPRKHEEIAAGRQILADIAAGRFRSVPVFDDDS